MMRSEIVGLNGELLLECDGCYWHVPTLTAFTWHDSLDSGLDIDGEYCRECLEMASSGAGLPNMGAGYSRYSIQCECSKCGAE